MELKVVQDLFKGGILSLFPLGLIFSSLFDRPSRKATFSYVANVLFAFCLQKRALDNGQLLRDIAWSRAHMLILENYKRSPEYLGAGWMESYERTLLRFPTPLQH